MTHFEGCRVLVVVPALLVLILLVQILLVQSLAIAIAHCEQNGMG